MDRLKRDHTRQKKRELFDFLIDGRDLDFSPASTPRVSILLVLFNRAELTLACLLSLKARIFEPIELIIVDNQSSDETQILLNRLSGAKVTRNPENVGFLKAANQAASLATTDTLVFLNNDAEIHDGCVEAALATLAEEDSVGAVGGRIVLLDGTLQEAGSIVWRDGSCLGFGRGWDPQHPAVQHQRPVDYCSGAFLATRRSLFETLGGFDEAFAPAYYEESDYCLRLREAGYEIRYEPACSITHFEFASSESSAGAIELMKRNQARFLEKHGALLATKAAPSLEHIWQARFGGPPAPKVLYIDDRVPHRHLGSGFPRSNAIVRSLVRAGARVTVVPANFPGTERWADAWADLPRCVELLLDTGIAALPALLQERPGAFDLLWVSRPHNMEAVLELLPPEARTLPMVYDAEAIFAERENLKASLETGRPLSPAAYRKLLANEARLWNAAQQVLTVNERECRIVREHLREPAIDVTVLGHALPCDPTSAGFDTRKGLLFVGNLDYEDSPNADSLRWFAAEVWPGLLESLPQLEFHVVGSCRAPSMQALGGQPGIHIHGRVDELRPFYERCRVFVAPTRYAAGIPFKVHEAAAQGLPIVISSILEEQLGCAEIGAARQAPVSCPDHFAEAVLTLYEDPNAWYQTRNRALAWVSEDCSQQRFEDTASEILFTTTNTNRGEDTEAS